MTASSAGALYRCDLVLACARGQARSWEVSGANGISGSQVGSQQGPTSSDTRLRSAIIDAGQRCIGRCQATSGDGGDVLWEQEAASSNLAIPTSSEYMSILVKIVCGPRWEPSVIALNAADRKRRGHGEYVIHLAHIAECRWDDAGRCCSGRPSVTVRGITC
jgi:hypothetical protein